MNTHFSLISPTNCNFTIVTGVLEFVAEEGRIYIPYWMFRNLCLQEGQRVTVKSGNLPKGDFVKFQPQSPEFIDIHNPKVSSWAFTFLDYCTLVCCGVERLSAQYLSN